MQSGRGSAAVAAAVGRVREETSRSRSLVLLGILHAQLPATMGRRMTGSAFRQLYVVGGSLLLFFLYSKYVVDRRCIRPEAGGFLAGSFSHSKKL